METKEKMKSFDAVNMMREIRDQITKETQNMTLEELKTYIKTKIRDSSLKKIG
ncbi:MAG TPA: hypothetical protein VD884_08610 [Ohtaekwangia sp.]|nr:hypothetical protein [Ohtaekwangia sp.]